MVTINTTEDLLSLLRENEEFREAVRRELLTKELLELPASFASFRSETRAEFSWVRAEFSNVHAEFSNVHAEFSNVHAEFSNVHAEFSNVHAEFSNVHAAIKRNADNIGDLKGMFMERAAREDAANIASDMGLRWKRTLERNEIVAIADEAVRQGSADGISRDSMRRFRRTDLVIEAANPEDEDCFIVVEVSYTADSRDTDRALLHANYIARFTGTPAYPAILSVAADNRIMDILTENTLEPTGANGEPRVFWSRLPEPERPN